MNPQIALTIVPLLIWAGVFAFIFSVDRRVRALERLTERQTPRETPLPTASVIEKETVTQ